MKVVAIIQARLGSKRLPAKVMLRLGEKSILAHVIARVAKAQGVDEIVVATSHLPQDDVVFTETVKMDVHCFRGSELDVLSRYYESAKFYNADVIIRITSDCPFLDPDLLSEMLKDFFSEQNKIDYLSNTVQRTFPKGLDLEIFTMKALDKAYHEAKLDYEREHVTPYIYTNQQFALRHYLNKDENFSNYRWTLDTPNDWKFISTVYDKLCNGDNDYFTTNEILALLKHEPHLIGINVQ